MKKKYCPECGHKLNNTCCEPKLILGDDLKVTHYQNGDSIPLATSNEQFIEFGKKEIGCYSINDKGHYLYNWYAVDDNRGLSPKGWRIPTDEEWDKLEEQLKEKPTYAGYRSYNYGNYYYVGNNGYFWSSTELNSNDAWLRGLYYNNSDVSRYDGSKSYGFSVRCVREE
jgi:hypothetical protein